jgi:hypothetical protein
MALQRVTLDEIDEGPMGLIAAKASKNRDLGYNRTYGPKNADKAE